MPNDVLEEGGEWLERLPEFKAWLASLSAKSLYRHLLESLNFADGADGLVEGLSPSQLNLALAATDDTGFDAHLPRSADEVRAVADAALPTLFSRAASQRDCVGHRLAG